MGRAIERRKESSAKGARISVWESGREAGGGGGRWRTFLGCPGGGHDLDSARPRRGRAVGADHEIGCGVGAGAAEILLNPAVVDRVGSEDWIGGSCHGGHRVHPRSTTHTRTHACPRCRGWQLKTIPVNGQNRPGEMGKRGGVKRDQHYRPVTRGRGRHALERNGRGMSTDVCDQVPRAVCQGSRSAA